jgi:hypothetical protein
MTERRNRIMIYGPKNDGTYIVEFGTAARRVARDPSSPGSEAAVIKHFQECMPYGLYVPDVGKADRASMIRSR